MCAGTHHLLHNAALRAAVDDRKRVAFAAGRRLQHHSVLQIGPRRTLHTCTVGGRKASQRSQGYCNSGEAQIVFPARPLPAFSCLRQRALRPRAPRARLQRAHALHAGMRCTRACVQMEGPRLGREAEIV